MQLVDRHTPSTMQLVDRHTPSNTHLLQRLQMDRKYHPDDVIDIENTSAYVVSKHKAVVKRRLGGAVWGGGGANMACERSAPPSVPSVRTMAAVSGGNGAMVQ